MHVYKIRIDTKVSGLHKYVIFCHFQNRQKKLFSVFSKIFCRLQPARLRNFGREPRRSSELRARAAPVIGTSFLLVMLRRGYSRAFPDLPHWAGWSLHAIVGASPPSGHFASQNNHPRSPSEPLV